LFSGPNPFREFFKDGSYKKQPNYHFQKPNRKPEARREKGDHLVIKKPQQPSQNNIGCGKIVKLPPGR
jgi:hypothetical protein